MPKSTLKMVQHRGALALVCFLITFNCLFLVVECLSGYTCENFLRAKINNYSENSKYLCEKKQYVWLNLQFRKRVLKKLITHHP